MLGEWALWGGDDVVWVYAFFSFISTQHRVRMASRAWVQNAVGDLSEPEGDAARLALLTALAPHQIDDAVGAAYQGHESADRRLLALLAWSSAQAARRISTWSTA